MDGKSLHMKAEETREKGEFLEALKFTDEATVAYQKEGNTIKLAEVQASRALTLRHLFEETGDKNCAILAKYAAGSAVEIIEKTGAKSGLAIPVYTLGKCQETLEEFESAKASYRKALDALAGSDTGSQTSPATLAEIKTRLAAIEYRLGDDSALARFEAALKDLEVAQEDSYNKSVWISGAHMHIAESFAVRGDKERSKSELGKAKEIIDSDERLILRKRQLERLKRKIA